MNNLIFVKKQVRSSHLQENFVRSFNLCSCRVCHVNHVITLSRLIWCKKFFVGTYMAVAPESIHHSLGLPTRLHLECITHRSSSSNSATFAWSFFFAFLGALKFATLWTFLPQLKQLPLNFFLGWLLCCAEFAFLFLDLPSSTILTPNIVEFPRDLFSATYCPLQFSILQWDLQGTSLFSYALSYFLSPSTEEVTSQS